MLTAPLPTLKAWTDCFSTAQLPVLARTAAELALLAELEEAKGCVDAHLVGEAIDGDPLMSVRLFSYLGHHRGLQQSGDAETVVAGVMLLGIGPFFREFAVLESVEQRLSPHPEALANMQKVMARSHRAARFALAFAAHRLDSDAMAVHEAALLHDIAELLLWIHAPSLASEVAARQIAHPNERSADIQLAVLNVRLSDLQQALMKAWRLPELLINLNDHSSNLALIGPQRRMVQLAVRLARHSSDSWQNAAIPDDVQDIADLLTMSTKATLRLLTEIDS